MPSALVLTDLDGTLLDHDTYSFEPALPAIRELARREIPLVLCTSKTRAEVEGLRARLELETPFITENGGGLFLPEPVVLGASHPDLVAALQAAAQETGIAVRGFHQMSLQEIGQLTALPAEVIPLAARREFDEPFVFTDNRQDPGPLLAAIERRGFRWTRGGRFYHVIGDSNKATAAKRLLEFYRKTNPGLRTLGLGDGPNDIEFLRETDEAVIVLSPRASELQQALPHARVTDEPGPAGWNTAVLDWLARLT